MHFTQPERIPLNRLDIAASVFLASLLLLIGAFLMVPGVCGVYHDDAIYVSTAKAIAHGDGYRLINLPHAPEQTKYPIFYPALLALLWKLQPSFPQNVILFQWLSLLSGSATIAICYLYLISFKYFSRCVSFCSCLVCVTIPMFIYFSTNTLSEMPFVLLTMIMLWTMEDGVRAASSRSRIRSLLQGIILALPFLCRTIGVIYIPIGLAKLYKSGRQIRWTVVGTLIVGMPVIIWMMTGSFSWTHDPVTGYYADYLGWWSNGVKSVKNLVGYNIIRILFATSSMPLAGLVALMQTLKSTTGLILFVFMGAVIWCLVLANIKQGRVLPLFLAGYLAIILFWPWPPSRFLIVFAPFLIGFFLNGCVTFMQSWSFNRLPKLGVPTVVGVILIMNTTTLVHCHSITKQYHYPYATLPLSDIPVSWSSFEEIFSWIRVHSQPNDAIASGLDSMIYLYTSRKSFRPFKQDPASLFYGQAGPKLGTTDDFAKNLKMYRPKYLVSTPMPYFAEEQPFKELIERVNLKYPGWLKTVYVGNDRRFVIYELMSNKGPMV